MSRRNENIFEEKSHLGRKIGVTLLVVLLLTFGAGAVANFAISNTVKALRANGHHSRFAQFAGSVVDSPADGFEWGVPRAESGVDWQSGWYARSFLRHHDGQYDWRERRRGAGAGTPGAASGGVEGAIPARQRRPVPLRDDGRTPPFRLMRIGRRRSLTRA